MIEAISMGNKCPNCKYELDDDDGVNLAGMGGEVKCADCDMEFYYSKQMVYNPDNPYCDYEWTATYFIEKGEMPWNKN